MSAPTATAPIADFGALAATVYTDGIVGCPGAFDRGWGERLAADFAGEFVSALGRPGGTVSRGPSRYYLAVHPERVRGFLDLVTHPFVTGLCTEILGPDHVIAELGFDVPLPGAGDQPWHRDFPAPAETLESRRLTSLAFNVTTVDVTPEMGPFEIAPGTHWETGDGFDYGMFPDRAVWDRYERLRSRRLPKLGDMSARTGLAVHRGTANRAGRMRPVLILGAVAPHVETDAHDLCLTRRYAATLPPDVLARLRCRVVDELVPIVQRHTIEGLVMAV
jgi:hypothetical protein